MPELFIITGSNGAGKSSIGPEYLPENIRQQGPIFDGDKLYVEKRKELWRTIKSYKECSKLAYAFVTETFDRLVEAALSGNIEFASDARCPTQPICTIPLQYGAAAYTITFFCF